MIISINDYLTIQLRSLTKYVSTLVYILLYLSNTVTARSKLYYINNTLSLLYGPMWAVGVCGLLINSYFAEEMHRRDRQIKPLIIFSDIFGHLLPIILMVLYGPKETDIHFIWYLSFVILFFLIFHRYLLDTYIGVPPMLILFAAPSISILAFYYRYYYKLHS